MMKKKFLTILMGWAMACTASLAQTAMPTSVQEWAARVEKFGKGIPQEQVFIHMDNNCYFLGDTLYYKAYVTRSDNGAPSKLSGLLYAELLNQDGYLVERQMLELKNGMADGSFCLLDTLYGGYYELRAYTRWQLNWGETQHPHTKQAEQWFFGKKQAFEYYRDYEKLYSRVFPVYDKPLAPGEYYHDMTLRPMRRLFKAEDEVEKAVLKCYPEGGNLVEGLPCRVAFEANNEEGKHLQGSVSLVDNQGQTLAEAKTNHQGRGMLTFTPKAGATYKAVFNWKKGTTEATLPKAETDGCAIQVTTEGEALKFNIAMQGAAASEQLGITLMHQGRQLSFTSLEPGKSTQFNPSCEDWPNGVIQLTVFNAQGRIYADRLFFHRRKDFNARNLSFEGVQTQYEPFAPIEMQVKGGLPGGNVSLAIRDAGRSEYIYDNASILAEMLLCSQIRGFVENPEYYFEKDDAERRQALDLLLMIQGWRRYDWRTMAVPGNFVLQHIPEHTEVIQGEVNNYQTAHATDELSADIPEEQSTGEKKGEASQNKPTEAQKIRDRFMKKGSNLKREMLVHAEFTKPGAEQGVVGEMMTKKGMFRIESPRFYEGCYLFLAAADSTKWKEGYTHMWIKEGEDKQERPNYPDFYVKLNPIFPRFVKPYNWYQCNLAELPAGVSKPSQWLSDGTRQLETVNVGAKRNKLLGFNPNKPAFVVDAYKAFNEVCDAGFCNGVYQGYERFAADLARTYIGDMNMERDYPLEIRLDSHTKGHFTSDKERDRYNHLNRLDKVYIYTDYSPRREGDKHFEQSNQPIVTIDLRLLPDEGQRITFRDRRYVLQGFSVCEDFYQPDYSQKPLPETADYRRTLYWNPSLTLDQNGEAQVRCFNNSQRTQVAISAEGMDQQGKLMSGREMPEDRK